jgi:MarR family transcriptional regulator, lower aerobic nicotinate degradation pathway regulator
MTMVSAGASSADRPVVGEGQSERLLSLPSRLLSQVAMHTDRLVTDALAAADARKWHYAVLVTLRDLGPTSQAALSRQTGIYRSDMVALITELSDRGLVQRAPDPADQRRNVITLTAKGHRAAAQLDTVVDHVQEEILAPLHASEREELTALLRTLLAHLAQDAPPAMRGVPVAPTATRRDRRR